MRIIKGKNRVTIRQKLPSRRQLRRAEKLRRAKTAQAEHQQHNADK